MGDSRGTPGPSPVGAEVEPGGGVRFRVWAPKRGRVEVVLEGGPGAGVGPIALERDRQGYFQGRAAGAGHGTLYRYRLDGGDAFPDPASRFQPEGVEGPSMVVDPSRYRWRDQGWRGRPIRGQVLYEMHFGTFTREGTYAAAEAELPALADLGVTVLEVLPLNEFYGRFGWGYDGVDWYAPTRLYGEPDDFRRFVDRAHELGLAVILDVVYNHFGAEGMFWREFSDAYFTTKYSNDWGDSINFDGPDSGPVREFVLGNAAYWVREFHLDGYRIDATQALFDDSPEPITHAIARVAREAGAGREILVIAENEPQHAELIRPTEPGLVALDAIWNDDLHHCCRVAATGRREGYHGDYHGTAPELAACFKHGFLYQGQFNRRQQKRRGHPAFGAPRTATVSFLQNHDQVANSHRGWRLQSLTSPELYRALTAVQFLYPGTPMLFQGQEFASSSPFFYFADHVPELAEPTRRGRIAFLAQFPCLRQPETVATMADPADPETFERSKLDHSERERGPHAAAWQLHRDLLRLRREDPTLASQAEHGIDASALDAHALVVRFRGATPEEDRLLLVNIGHDLFYSPPTDPLLAPPLGRSWQILWTSEAVRYGGSGTPEPETAGGWRIQGRAAVLMAPLGDGGLSDTPEPFTPDETEQAQEDGDGDER